MGKREASFLNQQFRLRRSVFQATIVIALLRWGSPFPMGQPIVDTDGSIRVEYEVREIPTASEMTSILWLLNISPDGSTTTTQLSSSVGANLFPGNIVPDGQGGVLATWTIANANPPAAPQPYQAAYVSAGAIVAVYPLPNAPTSLVTGADGLPVNPPLVLGENGTAFASYGPNVTSFAASSGTGNWNYQTLSQNSTSTLAAATTDLGLSINDSQQGLIQLDVSGNASPPIPGILGGTPYTLGIWYGQSNAQFAAFRGPTVDLTLPWPKPQGGRPPDHQADHPIIAHVMPFSAVIGIDGNAAVNEINGFLPKTLPAPDTLLGSSATVNNFLNELAKPIAAVGFFGHSALFQFCANPSTCVTYSVGLLLFDHVLIADPSLGTAQFPVPTQYENAAPPVKKINTQAKIVFIDACDIGPVFKNLWNIQSSTLHQAMIVPVGDESTVILGHGVSYWGEILHDMVNNHMTVQDAVAEANVWLLKQGKDVNKQPITEQWQVIGDGNVKIN